MALSDDLFNKYQQILSERTSKIQGRQSEEAAKKLSLEEEKGLGVKRSQLDDIRARATDVERRLEELPENLKRRTSGRLLTDAQLSGLITADVQTSIRDAESAIENAINLDRDYYNQLLSGYETEAGNLYSRAMTERQLEENARQAELARQAAIRQANAQLEETRRQTDAYNKLLQEQNRTSTTGITTQTTGGTNESQLVLKQMSELARSKEYTKSFNDYKKLWSSYLGRDIDQKQTANLYRQYLGDKAYADANAQQSGNVGLTALRYLRKLPGGATLALPTAGAAVNSLLDKYMPATPYEQMSSALRNKGGQAGYVAGSMFKR